MDKHSSCRYMAVYTKTYRTNKKWVLRLFSKRWLTTVVVAECKEILGCQSTSQLVINTQMFGQTVNQHHQSSVNKRK